MPRGGYRANAGRKPKPSVVKKLEGNLGHRPIEVVDFASSSIDIPVDPPSYLSERAKQIYTNVYKWLAELGCLKGIMPYNLEEYAYCKDRWMQAEEMVSSHGFSTIDDKGKESISPYVLVAKEYLKQANDVWNKIYQVVREAKLSKWDDSSPNDDVMEKLLGGGSGA